MTGKVGSQDGYRWFEIDPAGFRGGDENFYRIEADGPAVTTDPSGLAASIKDITVTNAGKGLGGVPLGVVAGSDAFAYGFQAKIEVGGKIQDAKISQEIFLLQRYSNGAASINILSDFTHNAARVTPTDALKALDAWGSQTETYMTDGGIADNLYNPAAQNFRHGANWVEYSDAPGWPGAKFGSPLPARGLKFAAIWLSVVIKATGTDGTSVVAEFSLSQWATNVGGKWVLRKHSGPSPALPHTFTPMMPHAK